MLEDVVRWVSFWNMRHLSSVDALFVSADLSIQAHRTASDRPVAGFVEACCPRANFAQKQEGQGADEYPRPPPANPEFEQGGISRRNMIKAPSGPPPTLSNVAFREARNWGIPDPVLAIRAEFEEFPRNFRSSNPGEANA
jgi:hypothetical protein